MSIIFETPRLVVRQITPGDEDALYAIFADSLNVRFYGNEQPWSRADVEGMVASYPAGDARLICAPGLLLLKPALEVVGFGGVGYYRQANTTADLMFIFKHEYWGRGLATELAQAAIAEAWRHPEVTTIYATVHPANAPSIRVLEKSGMIYQGDLPDKNRRLYRIDRGATEDE